MWKINSELLELLNYGGQLMKYGSESSTLGPQTIQLHRCRMVLRWLWCFQDLSSPLNLVYGSLSHLWVKSLNLLFIFLLHKFQQRQIRWEWSYPASTMCFPPALQHYHRRSQSHCLLIIHLFGETIGNCTASDTGSCPLSLGPVVRPHQLKPCREMNRLGRTNDRYRHLAGSELKTYSQRLSVLPITWDTI